MLQDGEILSGSSVLQVEVRGGFKMQFGLRRIAQMRFDDAKVILDLRGI